MMPRTLVFSAEGQDHDIELIDNPASEMLTQLEAWLPADISIHCAKIAGCHIYWPSPILAQKEDATDIHTLSPGAFLYYPDRQYLEIIYDELQAETAAVTYLGKLRGDIEWLREFAARQRREAGSKVFTASLRLQGERAHLQEPVPQGEARWVGIQRARRAVWEAEPNEMVKLLTRKGHNIPFGPMVTADGYFRFVQESLWQLWNRPDHFNDGQKRAAAINAMELGIARIGHYCHLSDSEALLHDAIGCVEAGEVPLQDLLKEVILYCSRMSNWIDLHIPWFPANELTKKTLGRND